MAQRKRWFVRISGVGSDRRAAHYEAWVDADDAVCAAEIACKAMSEIYWRSTAEKFEIERDREALP